MAKATAKKRVKRVPVPSKRWGWSWHDTTALVKFTVTAAGGFLAGFGGMFATSDNASRLVESKGWYAALGLTVLAIVKWAQLFHKDNTDPSQYSPPPYYPQPPMGPPA